jgi:hypothetical protein
MSSKAKKKKKNCLKFFLIRQKYPYKFKIIIIIIIKKKKEKKIPALEGWPRLGKKGKSWKHGW